MSITGRYVWQDGELVKISDRIPGIGSSTSDMCTFTKPYWEEHLGDKPVYITSRRQKAKLLKEQGCIEKAPVRGGTNAG